MTRRDHSTLLLFAGASFASAFLIFLVQPMVGKRILPWFGGVPAVWALCLAFFQTTLFAGYAYAHLLIRFATPAAQLALHALACAVALAVLPVLPGDVWKPDGAADPSLSILAMLGAKVALPFLVLAGTGPLVQAWYARIHADRSPYPLYAVSNLGSLTALLGYPFLLEPNLALSTTGSAWSIAFAVTAAAVLGCAAWAWRVRPERAVDPARVPARVSWLHRVLWVLFAGCAVVLLMGVTNALCLDTASLPFLWILPLATYLTTFILCFAFPGLYRRVPYLVLSVLAFLGPQLLAKAGINWSSQLPLAIARYCLLLFGTCMILHGELYRLRPVAARLTAYYLNIALGGALGGILVGVGAPLIFSDYYELPLGLAAAWLLLIVATLEDPRGWLRRVRPRWRLLLAVASTIALAYPGFGQFDRRPGVRYQERSFFGVLRVREVGREDNHRFTLMNGTTIHGWQFIRWRNVPTSYYGSPTGIGLALDGREPDVRSHIGVIGLGVGTVAAYGRAGDRIRFYEIDPEVVRLAQDEEYFTFLRDSPAEIEIVTGDGRLSLEADRARGLPRFDYLIVDAYSSDALPVHLLTREALDLYLESLEPGGTLAFHVSSVHFDLVPLLSRMAHDTGLAILAIRSPELRKAGSLSSRWTLLSRDGQRLAAFGDSIRRHIEPMDLGSATYTIWSPGLDAYPEAPLWTDDYSDLLSVLRDR